ncbi:MAG TPA: hypothetical protein DIW23_11025 [Anaerolineae bacterium]|nr:hypothetical protein [Anaerolineae bacterium]
MTEKNASQGFYYPQLDGLRFFAFLLVFIHNAPHLESVAIWKSLHEYGWIGVDIFFCLSAFLITKLLMLEYNQSKTIKKWDFYIRRVLKIYPIYLLYILIALFLSYKKTGWDQITLQILSLFTFTFNYVYILIFPKAVVLFVHLWTISFEAQFYLIAPYLVKYIKEIPNKTKWILFILILIAGLLIRTILIQNKLYYPVIYLLPFSHLDAMLGGIIIGSGIADKIINKTTTFIYLFLILLISYSISYLPNINEYKLGLILTYLFSGILSTLIIAMFSKNGTSILIKLFSLPLFVYLGKISYGLYIFHLLGNSITREFLPISHISIVFPIGLISTIFLASLSYYSIEKYFRAISTRYKIT